MILVDTDVLVEFRRGRADAIAWVEGCTYPVLNVPGVVAMEFIIGSRDKVELDRARRFVASLAVVWHSEADNELAFQLVEQHRLSTGLGLADYLIAAQALNRSATLYTFNLKHFQTIPGLDARAPYAR